MTRQISLTRIAQKVSQQGFSFIVTAASAVSMPNEIFVLKFRPLDPTTGSQVARFDHIATPSDLLNLPINSALPGGIQYRVAQVTLAFDTQDLGDQFWITMQSGVNALIRALNVADMAGTSTTLTLSG